MNNSGKVIVSIAALIGHLRRQRQIRVDRNAKITNDDQCWYVSRRRRLYRNWPAQARRPNHSCFSFALIENKSIVLKPRFSVSYTNIHSYKSILFLKWKKVDILMVLYLASSICRWCCISWHQYTDGVYLLYTQWSAMAFSYDQFSKDGSKHRGTHSPLATPKTNQRSQTMVDVGVCFPSCRWSHFLRGVDSHWFKDPGYLHVDLRNNISNRHGGNTATFCDGSLTYFPDRYTILQIFQLNYITLY